MEYDGACPSSDFPRGGPTRQTKPKHVCGGKKVMYIQDQQDDYYDYWV